MYNFNKVRKMYEGFKFPQFGNGAAAYTNQTGLEFFGLTGNSNLLGTDTPVPSKTTPTQDNLTFKDKVNRFTNNLSDDAKNAIINTVGNIAQVGTQKLNEDMYFTESGETAHKIGNMLGEIPVLENAFKVGQFGVSSIVKGLSSELGEFDYDRSVAERMGGSYNFDNITRASEISGKKAFGKGLKEGRNIINTAEQQMQMLAEIDQSNQNRQAVAANVQQNSTNYNNILNGGLDTRYLRAAKLGIKLININRLKSFKTPQIVNINTKQVEEFKQEGTITEPIDKFKEGGVIDFTPIIYSYTDPIETDVEFIPVLDFPEEVTLFKDGGKTEETELVKLEETNQKNVIPEGALHKNKHHIENTEGLTQKGIPVIDNDGEQQAEIELDEIIFTLEVTNKLEELHKIYKEGTNKEQDEAAIEAGKLLVQEILYNTDDRTGLISKCKEGGKING